MESISSLHNDVCRPSAHDVRRVLLRCYCFFLVPPVSLRQHIYFSISNNVINDICVRVQMAFWQNRSVSLVDMYIDNSEPTENVGQIHFSLEYDFQNTTLILKIMQVRFISLFLCFFILIIITIRVV